MEPFEREVVSDLDEHTDDRAEARRRIPLARPHPPRTGRRRDAGQRGARAVLGPDSPALAWVVGNVAEPVGQLFLRSLLMTVVPLVVSSLIVGVAGIGDVRRLGRVGVRTVGFCLVISIVSVGLGILLANTVRPGTRLDPATRDLLMAQYAGAVEAGRRAGARRTNRPLMSFARTLVPANPLESMARSTPDMIGIMFFSIVFGAALTLVSRESAAPVIALLEGIFKVDREGHRHRHEGRANRRRVPAVYDDRALRVRVSHQPRLVRHDRAWRARDSHVRGVSDRAQARGARLAGGILQARAHGHAHGVFDELVERDPADRSARVRV